MGAQPAHNAVARARQASWPGRSSGLAVERARPLDHAGAPYMIKRTGPGNSSCVAAGIQPWPAVSGLPMRVIARAVSSSRRSSALSMVRRRRWLRAASSWLARWSRSRRRAAFWPGQFAGLARPRVLAPCRGGDAAGCVAQFGGDVVIVAPERRVGQAEAAGQGEHGGPGAAPGRVGEHPGHDGPDVVLGREAGLAGHTASSSCRARRAVMAWRRAVRVC
jgi:hypothetical protein